MIPNVAMIGLGAIGQPMAQQLLDAKIPTTAYDLNAEALEAFTAAGGTAAASTAEAVQHADVLLLMVVNAAQVEAVLFGDGAAVDAMPPGCVVVVGSTIMPGDAERIAARLTERGFPMVDAPVSGGVAGAKAGTLSVMASGQADAFERARPLFEAYGGNIFNLGETVGKGSTVKVINQHLCGVHIAAAAEALALGVRAGVDSATLLEIISVSAGRSWMFEDRVPHMVANDYTPTSAVDIFVKDLGIVLDTGRYQHFPLPVAAAAHQMFLMATAAGFGKIDDSAVVKVYEQMTGIDVTSEKNRK